jgi:hypothetical protein
MIHRLRPHTWPGPRHLRLWWHTWRHQWHLDHITPGYAWIAEARAQRLEAIRRGEE